MYFFYQNVGIGDFSRLEILVMPFGLYAQYARKTLFGPNF
jgi:hypothetical protein